MIGEATAEQLFTWAAELPCGELRKDCLERHDLFNMVGCFQGRTPPGVAPDVYDAFCAKMDECGIFDIVGCEPEASEAATEAFGEPTACLDAELRALFEYCDKHGFEGPDAEKNAMCWAAHVSPNRTRVQRNRPSCPDVDCLDRTDFSHVGACFTGQASCPGDEWADAMRQLPLCPDTKQQLREQARRALLETGCLKDDIFEDVVYCLEHGPDGPDPAENAACYAMQATGMLAELARAPSCKRDVTPEEHTASDVPSAEEPRRVEPASTAPASEPEAPAEDTEDWPPEAEEDGLSTAWIIGGGVALVAAIGAGVYFMRKKR